MENHTEKQANATENSPSSEHHEKDEQQNPPDHDSDKEYHLQKENTLGVDTNNEFAVKGDSSDGKISWTITQFIATICLAGLYVGQ